MQSSSSSLLFPLIMFITRWKTFPRRLCGSTLGSALVPASPLEAAIPERLKFDYGMGGRKPLICMGLFSRL